MKVVPQFKVANAVIHFDETSPHMHLIGLPISDNNKRGMKKQVAKSKIFTKESLTKIQDEMRNKCIKSYNKYYEKTAELKKKQKGRNQDINVKDMSGYKDFKKQLKKNEQRLAKANLQTENLDNASKDITKILDNLKPTLMNKNNMVISSENVQRIKNFTKDVKDTNKTIRSVKDLELAIKDFEYSTNLIAQGKIVANFQGRLEFGPRALGNRSILADPRRKEMLYKLNTLKGREVWRPLAPAVLYEEQTRFFSSCQFSPYMTINCRVLESVQNELEAITHVDGTARIQSVSKSYNNLFHNSIDEFYKITGIPVVINTSFNIKGEPIVDTPEKAIESAIAMNLDYLAMGRYIIKVHI